MAFRGTDERADWWTNLRLIPETTPWGRVHQGFQQAANAFWPELAQHAREATERQERLWITGHNLGGAMAMLAAARLTAEEGTDLDGLYTYGQSPAAYRRFARRVQRTLQDRYFRFVNYRDAVVHLALGELSEHVGQLFYFDRQGVLHDGPSFWSQLSCLELSSVILHPIRVELLLYSVIATLPVCF